MATPQEQDFPAGHPGRSDYNPDSPEAKQWAREHYSPKGERDFPVGHPKASDTPDNDCGVSWAPGVNPKRTDLQPFTGRTLEQVAALREYEQAATAAAVETPPREPGEAPPPPKETEAAQPTGQPGS